MSCNSCAKPFTLLRKEKGCPSCGFSFCSKCLDNKVYVSKLNAEAKVCAKCTKSTNSDRKTVVVPPDAFFKLLGESKSDKTDGTATGSSNIDKEIADRLRKLKEEKEALSKQEQITKKLQNIKGDLPKTTDAELQERLARLRGVPVSTVQSQPLVVKPDLRSEQEQADELMKQYLEQVEVDTKYKDEFDELVNNMESRLGKLKDAGRSGSSSKPVHEESEEEEETVKKIIEKAKASAILPEQNDELPPSTDDELPFCEICNEDATMRCLGCRYLFCKRCFLDHKDDDDECNRYEAFTPPKGE